MYKLFCVLLSTLHVFIEQFYKKPKLIQVLKHIQLQESKETPKPKLIQVLKNIQLQETP
jgi:hypothetical protein